MLTAWRLSNWIKGGSKALKAIIPPIQNHLISLNLTCPLASSEPQGSAWLGLSPETPHMSWHFLQGKPL